MLPAVYSSSLLSWLTEGEFVPLNQLLPENGTPVYPNRQKNIVLDISSNQLVTKTKQAKKAAFPLEMPGCGRFGFIAYRVAVNPNPAIALAGTWAILACYLKSKKNTLLRSYWLCYAIFTVKLAATAENICGNRRRNPKCLISTHPRYGYDEKKTS